MLVIVQPVEERLNYMKKEPCVYIMTNRNHTVLYTGVTSDIVNRVQQHKSGQGGSFTSRYKVTKLVFMERFPNMTQAIHAEKQIKAGSRAKKIALIQGINPDWRDLAEELC